MVLGGRGQRGATREPDSVHGGLHHGRLSPGAAVAALVAARHHQPQLGVDGVAGEVLLLCHEARLAPHVGQQVEHVALVGVGVGAVVAAAVDNLLA